MRLLWPVSADTQAAVSYVETGNMLYADCSRIIRNLDQIQNSSTARALCIQSEQDRIAKDAIHDVVAELEAKAESA
jgi:hypothetical protein